MKLYQIYVPELASYVKYRILSPEEIETTITELSSKTAKEFKLGVLESIVYNIKSEISDLLRLMPRETAEKCIEALYNRVRNAKSRYRY